MTYQFSEPPPQTAGWLTTRGAGDDFDHRGMVLRKVCDLEFECAQLLFAFFQGRNGAVTWDRAQEDLFGENGLLGSLPRMIKICSYLGLIGEDEAFDLRKLAKLRNMYAHGRERGQFLDDAEAVTVLRSLRLVQNSTHLLAGVTDEGLLQGAAEFLKRSLAQRRASLLSPSAA